MHFQRTLFSIGLLGVALFTADVVSAREGSLVMSSRFNLKSGERLNLEDSSGVSVTNDVSVSASTGGNSASGANGQPGGTITTGSAKAEIKVNTQVSGEADSAGSPQAVVDIDEQYEGEAKIEKEFENASGTVRTKIRVEVDDNKQPTTNSQQQKLREEREKVEVKRSWFSRFWPFWGDDDSDDDEADENIDNADDMDNNVASTSSMQDEIEITEATSTQADADEVQPPRNTRGAFRSFFRDLFSFFGF